MSKTVHCQTSEFIFLIVASAFANVKEIIAPVY